ncbi:hypothetical protein [Granulicella arctica]|uniref:hypothetical protein n=1 Tax=Granulicella arctica TaxID=940613 RepID=UPI0021DF63B9|nr:hypothetical protein [Granulicella arctica]
MGVNGCTRQGEDSQNDQNPPQCAAIPPDEEERSDAVDGGECDQGEDGDDDGGVDKVSPSRY